MRKTVLILTAASVALSACAQVRDSRFNPLNWFGSTERVATTGARADVPPLLPANSRTEIIDRREPIAEVTTLDIERTATGALVVATGRTATAGYFNAELVPVPTQGGPGAIVLQFRAQRPETAPTGGQQITAAKHYSNQELAGISSITVEGAANAIARRR